MRVVLFARVELFTFSVTTFKFVVFLWGLCETGIGCKGVYGRVAPLHRESHVRVGGPGGVRP